MNRLIRITAILAIVVTLSTIGLDAARPKHFILVNLAGAPGGSVVCVARMVGVPPARPAPACVDAVADQFVSRDDGVEIRVINRRFLTDYALEVTGVVAAERPSFRGIEDVAGLTLGAPTIAAPPPSKSAVAPPGGTAGVIQLHGVAEFFKDLINEQTAELPERTLRADQVALNAESDRVDRDLTRSQIDVSQLLGVVAPPSCGRATGSPTIRAMRSCLEAVLPAQVTAMGHAPYSDEAAFILLRNRVDDVMATMPRLQSALTALDIPNTVTQRAAEIDQYQQDRAIHKANLGAADVALRLASQLLSHPDAFKALRDAQLQNEVATLAGAKLDAVEINALASALQSAMRPGVPSQPGLPLHIGAASLASALVFLSETEPGPEGNDFVNRLSVLMEYDTQVISSDLATINADAGQILADVDSIYDHSAIAAAIPLPGFDLGSHPGNLNVTFDIAATPGFQRYRLTASPTSATPSTVVLPPGTSQLPPPKDAAATPPPSQSGSSAVGATDNSTAVVAIGSFEVHEFSAATVTATFAMTHLKASQFTLEPQPAASTGTTTSTAAGPNPIVQDQDQGFQTHILLGLIYYVKPRDTYPNARTSLWSMVGITGGVSATALDTYFIGAALEPVLGAHFSFGWIRGTETRLTPPNIVGQPSADATSVQTFSSHVHSWFVGAGLDIGLFKKIFGTVTGVGSPPPPTPSTTAGS